MHFHCTLVFLLFTVVWTALLPFDSRNTSRVEKLLSARANNLGAAPHRSPTFSSASIWLIRGDEIASYESPRLKRNRLRLKRARRLRPMLQQLITPYRRPLKPSKMIEPELQNQKEFPRVSNLWRLYSCQDMVSGLPHLRRNLLKICFAKIFPQRSLS